jgi:hypothetical protein
MSRPIVRFLKDLKENIYYSQASQSERNSRQEFREERGKTELLELQRQKELEKLAKKLKVIDKERKMNRHILYPHCNYDYGHVTKWYDPTTGESVLSYMPRKIDLAHLPKR